MNSPKAIAFVFTIVFIIVAIVITCDISFMEYDRDWIMKGVSNTHQFLMQIPQSLTKSEEKVGEKVPLLFESCKLFIHDPYFADMNKTIRDNNPIMNCNRNFRSLTQLSNGKLTIKSEALNRTDYCRARCLLYKSEWKNDYSPWLNISNSTFECDFVQSKCFRDNKTVENFIHTQIWKPKKGNNVTNDGEEDSSMTFKPDVFMIIVDSVSSTQMRRSLPKTLDFLAKNMSSITFHYLNKVADNSKPNGYAMLLNWRLSASDRSMTGGSYLDALVSKDTECHKHRDNDSVIYKEYEKAGYTTLHTEDYNGNIFSWPKCAGFKKQPTHHYYRPFVNEWYSKDVQQKTRNCFEQYAMMIDHGGKFLDAYPDVPKFWLYWTATLAHDDANTLFHADSKLESFFKQYEKRMRNAFVFFMGDHGGRFGASRKTQLGPYEVNNPFLIMTIPERLRSNKELLKNMKTNSEKLIHQYDIYATLVDILKFAPKNNFQQFPYTTILEENPNNGTSIIRPLGPFSERNCNNIPVDSSYCLCQFDLGNVKNKEVEEMFGHLFVDHINSMIAGNNLTDRCQALSLNKVTSLKAFAPLNETNMYEVKFEVSPGGGTFRASALYNSPNNILKREGSLQRTNGYKNHGDCVQNDFPTLRPYCYCK